MSQSLDLNKTNHFKTTASRLGKSSCAMCYRLNDRQARRCYLCDAKIHHKKKYSLQNTIALLITSVILYIPANLYPIMHTTYLGEVTPNTILGGVVTLWEHGSYLIALVIFIASVMVPVVKIIALGWLCYSVQIKRIHFFKNNHMMFRMTEFIGRWSMVDVFVVTILVALIQMGNLIRVMPGVAAIAFAAMVVSTMLAASSFDPRLIWDKPEKNSSKSAGTKQHV